MQKVFTFSDIVKLNRHINNFPENIEIIDVKIFTVRYKDNNRIMPMSFFPTEDIKYSAYILFNDKSSYNEFKETSLIPIEYDFHTINAVRVYITLPDFFVYKTDYNIEIIEIEDEDAQEEPIEVIVKDITYSDRTNWGGDISFLHHAWTRGYTGKNIKIAVIDTAFRLTDYDNTPLEEHVVFQDGSGHAVADHGDKCISAIGSRLNNKLSVGTAPDSLLYGLETNLHGGWINNAFQWCIDNRMDIISCSFISTLISETRKRLLDAIHEEGIICVAGAGNDPEIDTYYPAAYNNVISVGAVKKETDGSLVPPYYGATNEPWIDFIFSGQDVAVTRLSMGVDKEPLVISMAGTSVACPGMAGFIACIKEEFPKWTKAQITAHIKRFSFSVENRYGVFPMYYNTLDSSGTVVRITDDGRLLLKRNYIEYNETPKKISFYENGNLKAFKVNIDSNCNTVTMTEDSITCKELVQNADI